MPIGIAKEIDKLFSNGGKGGDDLRENSKALIGIGNKVAISSARESLLAEIKKLPEINIKISKSDIFSVLGKYEEKDDDMSNLNNNEAEGYNDKSSELTQKIDHKVVKDSNKQAKNIIEDNADSTGDEAKSIKVKEALKGIVKDEGTKSSLVAFIFSRGLNNPATNEDTFIKILSNTKLPDHVGGIGKSTAARIWNALKL